MIEFTNAPLAVRHFNHCTGMFSLPMWDCNSLLFCLIHLNGRKSLHFETTRMSLSSLLFWTNYTRIVMSKFYPLFFPSQRNWLMPGMIVLSYSLFVLLFHVYHRLKFFGRPFWTDYKTIKINIYLTFPRNWLNIKMQNKKLAVSQMWRSHIRIFPKIDHSGNVARIVLG